MIKKLILKIAYLIKIVLHPKNVSLFVGLIIFVITLYVWNINRRAALEKLSIQTSNTAELYTNQIDDIIENIEFNLEDLAGDGIPNSESKVNSWDQDANFYVENFTGLSNVVWIDSNIIVRRVIPMDSEQFTINSALNSSQSDDNHVNLIYPIMVDSEISGFILGNVDVIELMISAGEEYNSDYMIQVFKDDQWLAETENWAASSTDIQAEEFVFLKTENYRIVLTPTNDMVQKNTYYSFIILVFGSTFSVLIASIWYSIKSKNIKLNDLVAKKTIELRKTIEGLKQREDELSHASTHDFLTGLYNRRFFENKLIKSNLKKNLPMAVIMIDVNGLKIINDSFGHDIGDKLLKKVSSVLVKIIGDDGLVFRVGGDEFIILLLNTKETITDKYIDKIQSFIGEEKVHEMNISVSIGYAIRKLLSEPVEKVVKKAEDEMYKSKLGDANSQKNSVIQTMMVTLFEKDDLSESHSKRVSEYAYLLAKSLHLSDAKAAELKTAGLLHDIGKITISNAVLNKKGKLSYEEYEEIKKHPETGYRILKSVKNLGSIAESVLYHHERIDGHGYPEGLSGMDIPIESRILSICDAYDAMTSFRSYRDPLSKEVAIDQLIMNENKQFDEAITNIFISQVINK